MHAFRHWHRLKGQMIADRDHIGLHITQIACSEPTGRMRDFTRRSWNILEGEHGRERLTSALEAQCSAKVRQQTW